MANPCELCESASTSVIDAVEVHESAAIVIVGGGPHALAALAALQEGSLAYSQYGTDQLYATGQESKYVR